MTACARPGCGKPIDAKTTGRPAKYCSARCRVADSEARRAAAPSDADVGVRLTKPLSGRSGGRFHCPVDASHGKLLDWPTDRWAWYCPSQEHDGHGDVPQSRAFITTTEAESGVTSVPRSSTVQAEHSSTPARTADGSVVPGPSTSEAVDPPGGRLSSSPAASGVGTRSGPPATSHVSVERVGGARAEAQLALALGSAPAT